MAVSENTIKVLEYVKAHNGEAMTKDTIAEALGLQAKAVTLMINYWASERGGNLLARVNGEEYIDEKGKTKVIKYITYVGQ